MIFKLIDFALMMFKVCGIIGISKIEFLRFSDEELNRFFEISLNGTVVSFIGNKVYNNQDLTHRTDSCKGTISSGSANDIKLQNSFSQLNTTGSTSIRDGRYFPISSDK